MNRKFLGVSGVLIVFGILAVLHMTNTFLETSAGLVSNTEPGEYNSSKKDVVLVFDDGWRIQYEYALPVLKRLGIKGTFNIIAGAPAANRASCPECSYMTWDEIEELHQAGMEIGSHSLTHPDLTSLNQSELEREILLSKEILEGRGYEVSGFSYPYNIWNEHVMEEVKKYYSYAILGEFKHPFNPAKHSWTAIDTFIVTEHSPAELASLIENTLPGETVVLLYHHISDKYEDHATTKGEFTEQMEYLAEHYNILPLRDYFSLFEPKQ